MTALDGYRLEHLVDDESFSLFRAHPEATARGRMLLRVAASGSAAASLQHEYALREELDEAWAVRPLAFTELGGHCALLLEDPGGEPLSKLLERPPDAVAALRLAIAVVAAVSGLHRRGLIHKGIKPAGVLVDADRGRARLMDFGVASRRGRERPPPAPVEALSGPLAYMAPEQTGRVNRPVDSRTDLYALGVTLYQLFTGELPFAAAEPMEWIHCHIARQPVPAGDRSAAVPAALSDVLAKLLAKSADERYQTAAGLEADLRHCLAELRATGGVAPFRLGRRDVPHRLRIPERLYGREREVAALVAGFERTAARGAAEIMVITGERGIGKSALAHELRKALGASRCLFLAGRFEHYRGEIPYAAFAQAVRALVRHLLGKSEAQLAPLRTGLAAALGGSGRLLVDLVPELQLVVGPQPPLVSLGPREAEIRFHTVFRRFVGVFARPDRPVVLFLDDLHRADAASIALLASLAAHPGTGHLFVVGACRTVDDAHPLRRALDGLRQGGVSSEEIALAPMSGDEVGHLVADALGCAPGAVRALGRLLHDKTAGNPFFTSQLLTALADEELIVCDGGSAAWHWDSEAVSAALGSPEWGSPSFGEGGAGVSLNTPSRPRNGPAVRSRSSVAQRQEGSPLGAEDFVDDVTALMARKQRRVSASCRDTLSALACFAHGADAATLATLRACTVKAVREDLVEAVHAGLLLRDERLYRFVHDCMQDAALALVPEEERPARHLAIARRLASASCGEVAERGFDLASHFNRGAALIDSAAEREYVAAVNARAGRHAKAAVAYRAARRHLAQAATMLAEDGWGASYEDAFELHLDLAECEYLDGEPAAAEARFAALLRRARSSLDSARVHRLRGRLCRSDGRLDAAAAAAMEGLRLLGVDLPEDDATIAEAVRVLSEEIGTALAGRSIASLSRLSAATDPEICMAIGLIGEALPAACEPGPGPHALLAATGVSLSMRYGNAEESASCYSAYAVLRAATDDVGAAYDFSLLATTLDERGGAVQGRSANLIRHALFVNHRRHPFGATLRWFDRGHHAALDAGDFLGAGEGLPARTVAMLAAGAPLGDVLAEARPAAQLTRSTGCVTQHESLQVLRQFVACLQGRTEGPTRLDDNGYSEAESLARLQAAGSRFGVGMLHACKLAAAVHYDACSEALVAAAEHALPGLSASMAGQLCRFHRALALAALHPRATAERRLEYRRTLEAELAAFGRWAGQCPENFSAWYALLEAEVARLDGRDLDALRAFEAAVAGAHENGFIQHEALASELAGRFYLERGLATSALAHLGRARACYVRWGAEGKVRQLDERYPELEPPRRRRDDRAAGAVRDLDAITVVRASQAVSGEIVLERLIATLMEIAVEHAGAGRGVLVLPGGECLHTRAVAEVGRGGLDVRLCDAPVTADDLPEALLNYVVRARESVIVDDALGSRFHHGDGYVGRYQPRSMLCLPLIKQGELMGLLYLENRLAPGCFTSDRLAVLEVLASQAAISIANAALFAELQEENAGRRRAEAARKESRALLESIMDNVSAVIFVKDVEGRYLLVNRRYQELHEVTMDELVGRTDHDLFPGELADKLRDADRAVVATGRALEVEETVPGITGVRTYLSVKCPLFDADGKVCAVCGIATDITELKQAEADRRARLAAEAASRAKTEFLGRMSHELRTPLNAILGYAQILARDPAVGERQATGLGTILHSGQHLLTLINDLLDLAKIEAGRLDLSPVPMLLYPFLAGVTDIIRVKAEEKGLQFAYETPQGLPAAVIADEVRLRQVLLNLLGNAVKFTDRGRVGLIVRLVRDAGAGDVACLRFEVSDSGVGMAEDEMGGIFQPFEQAGEVHRRAAGTGLGLAICRELVGLMGAEIQVESTLGLGSRFWFQLELPLARVTAPMPFADPAALPVEAGPAAGRRVAAEALQAPPGEEMAVLHRLALAGNMHDIVCHATYLAESDEHYRPFAEHLIRLARSYESKAILALVERHLGDARA